MATKTTCGRGIANIYRERIPNGGSGYSEATRPKHVYGRWGCLLAWTASRPQMHSDAFTVLKNASHGNIFRSPM